MRIVTYYSDNALSPGQAWIAWLTEEVSLVIDKKKTGETKLAFLPVYFYGEAREVAEERARSFWVAETGKKQAKIDRGRAAMAKRWGN